jgi:hypothetical protein
VALADELRAVLLRTVGGAPIRDLGAWCHANVHRARASPDARLREAFQIAMGRVYLHETHRATDAETRAAAADLARRDDLLGSA